MTGARLPNTVDGGKHTFLSLDAMRGVAALFVLLSHTTGTFTKVDFVPVAYVAVDIFFVLSGFVIAYSYEDKLRGGMSALDFMTRRAIRLYPLYLAGLALAIAAAAADLVVGKEAIAPGSLAASVGLEAMFLPSPFGDVLRNLYPLNPVAWSLFFELLINAAYVLFFPLLSNRVLAGVIAAAGAMLAVMVLCGVHLSYGWGWDNAWVAAPRVMFGFTAGVLICRLRPLAPKRVVALGPTAPLALLMLMLGAPLAIAGQPVVLGFILLGAPMLVILASNVEPGARLRPAFMLLGSISYALYVLHFPLLSMTGWISRHLGAPVLVSIPAVVVVLVVFSALMDRYFDRPVRRELTRRWSQRLGSRSVGAPPTSRNA